MFNPFQKFQRRPEIRNADTGMLAPVRQYNPALSNQSGPGINNMRSFEILEGATLVAAPKVALRSVFGSGQPFTGTLLQSLEDTTNNGAPNGNY